MLYQKINCLLSACENQLTQAKIQGIESIPFRYIKNYISPANKALATAKSYYPQTEIADIKLLEIDLAVVESRVWEACGQSDTAYRTIFKASELANKALDPDKIASDTKKKLLLRKASILLTYHSVSPNIVSETEKLLLKAQKIQSGNTELDLSVLTFYAKFMVKYKETSHRDYATLEKTIKNAVGTLELLRTSNLAEMDFTARKNYFTTRTELYEALMMLYAKQNRPYAMLKAMDQIRSRAIQDVIIKNKIENQKQLQSILAKNKGMLLAYYVGADHVWIVSFTGNRAEISQTKYSGQEISAMCWNVLQAYSDVRHLQAYLRYGPQYKTMTEAFKVSHTLYSELFEKHHNNFMYNKFEHLYLIPSNVLNYLPLSTLVVEVDLNNVFKSKFIADDTIPITYLTSINCLAENNIANRKASSLILARGDYSYPAYYNNDSSNPDNLMAQPLNLPGTAGEGLTVAKLLKTGADEIPLTLLARAIQGEIKISPVFLEPEEKDLISNYEDISIEESVKGQIELAGCKISSEEEADILLYVNNFKKHQGEIVMKVSTEPFRRVWCPPQKPYMIADVRFANGADNFLVKQIFDHPADEMFCGFAAWNTSANTLGSLICAAKVKFLAKKYNKESFLKLQMTRFMDDWAYQANCRQKLEEADVKVLRKIIEPYKNRIQKFLNRKYNTIYKYPWNRLFEVEIECD